MPSSRETNTMAEGCRALLNQITKMKVEPDADLAFLVNLETTILSYLKAPSPEEAAQQPQQGPLGDAMGQVMGQPQMASPMAPMAMGGGPSPLGSPDEVRRMLGQAAARSSIHRIASRIAIP